MAYLKSSDGMVIEAPPEIIKRSNLIKTMVEGGSAGDTPDTAIDVLGITGDTLTQVVDWCRWYTVARPRDLPNFRWQLGKNRVALLFRLLEAAAYLEMDSLVETIVKQFHDILDRSGTTIAEFMDWLNNNQNINLADGDVSDNLAFKYGLYCPGYTHEEHVAKYTMVEWYLKKHAWKWGCYLYCGTNRK